MGKPVVYVLMAIYNPDPVWLKEQLISVNNQDYEDIKLLVCDDCSTSITAEDIRSYLDKYITRYPYRIIRNESNLGSNMTFEQLTVEASRDLGGQSKESYFAYCDQDDIWESNKITELVKTAQEKDAVLVYSDMAVIDSRGEYVSDSITKVRKRFRYYEGYDLWKRILIRNFISGCCMIVRADIADAAVPFSNGMQHDRWISIIASCYGYIAFVDKPLVRYRQHGKNQTGVLKDVTDKESYIKIRLKDHLRILEDIKGRKIISNEMNKFLTEYIEQMETRCRYAEGKHHLLPQMMRYLKYNRATILFEIVAMKLPEKIFIKALDHIKSKNI